MNYPVHASFCQCGRKHIKPPETEMSGQRVNVLQIWEILPIASCYGCVTFHSHWQWLRLPDSPQPC